jgi:hypothetical protein
VTNPCECYKNFILNFIPAVAATHHHQNFNHSLNHGYPKEGEPTTPSNLSRRTLLIRNKKNSTVKGVWINGAHYNFHAPLRCAANFR